MSEVVAQEMSGKFLPAFFVDVVELGQEFESGKLPLHMTYFPPIQDSFDPRLAQHIRRLVNPIPPFEAVVGHAVKYGPERDRRALLIEHHPRLLAVHRALVCSLAYLTHDARYRTPYSPHVTIAEEDTRLKPGDTIEMAGLSIVEKSAMRNVWTVMAKIGLKGQV